MEKTSFGLVKIKKRSPGLGQNKREKLRNQTKWKRSASDFGKIEKEGLESDKC